MTKTEPVKESDFMEQWRSALGDTFEDRVNLSLLTVRTQCSIRPECVHLNYSSEKLPVIRVRPNVRHCHPHTSVFPVVGLANAARRKVPRSLPHETEMARRRDHSIHRRNHSG